MNFDCFCRDGRLQEGDQILAIDGQPLDSNISHQQAISILQQARGLVELVVARGGITTAHQASTTGTVSLERSPSAVSDTSKASASDMVVSTLFTLLLTNRGVLFSNMFNLFALLLNYPITFSFPR